MRIRLILLVLLIIPSFLHGQEEAKNEDGDKEKGEFYFFWGWNRGWYSKSDIRFWGDNYDFTIYDVVAKDRQTPFGLDPYFNPVKITCPQTNMRAGYYIKKNMQVSLGVDHMKYVMQQNQRVPIDGYINAGTPYDGTYSNTSIVLVDNFLSFEHTDGLNYINSEFRMENRLFHIPIKKAPINIYFQYGAGVGILFPKTNTKLLNNQRYDHFHVAGWGTDLVTALQLTVGKHFFIQSDFKGGFISMQDIRTTMHKSDRASQRFEFIQSNILIGWRFRLFKS